MQTLPIEIENETVNVKRLLQPGDANTKLRKNSGQEFETVGLSLSPHTTAGIGNTCPHASPGCAAACLDHQGLASVFRKIGLARKAKTLAYYNHRAWFLNRLSNELENAVKRTAGKNRRLAARLNVFSDIPWEHHAIVEAFPQVEFYDYTKNPKRAGQLAPNYWVTFSRSETNEADCLELLSSARNVAVVFADCNRPLVGNKSHLQELPKSWNGFQVIDGDTTDLRFTDIRGRKRGRVIGLRLKAHSIDERKGAIDSGFAVDWRRAGIMTMQDINS